MYKIPEELLLKTINYLATKPYREVFDIISLLSKLKKEDQQKE